MVLPSRKTTRIAGIDVDGKPIEEAFAPMSVALRLTEEIDVSRGDMLVHPTSVPRAERRFDAMLVWMHERALDLGKSYLLKHTTQTVRAEIEKVDFTVDLESLTEAKAEGQGALGLNDIGRVTVRAHRPLFIDAYRENRATGAFVLIDSLTNDTVAAGMILESDAALARAEAASAGLDGSQVSARERKERLGHAAAAFALRGGSRASRRAAAFAAERLLFDRGCFATVVDVEGREGEEATVACVAAGLVALSVEDAASARAAIEARLGAERVIAIDVKDESDAERAGAEIAKAVEARLFV
jgi:selenocysteine-specific translation elongation factor